MARFTREVNKSSSMKKGNSLIQHETLIVYRLTDTIPAMFFAEPNSIGHEPDMVYFPKGKSCRP